MLQEASGIGIPCCLFYFSVSYLPLFLTFLKWARHLTIFQCLGVVAVGLYGYSGIQEHKWTHLHWLLYVTFNLIESLLFYYKAEPSKLRSRGLLQMCLLVVSVLLSNSQYSMVSPHRHAAYSFYLTVFFYTLAMLLFDQRPFFNKLTPNNSKVAACLHFFTVLLVPLCCVQFCKALLNSYFYLKYYMHYYDYYPRIPPAAVLGTAWALAAYLQRQIRTKLSEQTSQQQKITPIQEPEQLQREQAQLTEKQLQAEKAVDQLQQKVMTQQLQLQQKNTLLAALQTQLQMKRKSEQGQQEFEML